jgi:hypothetical protein
MAHYFMCAGIAHYNQDWEAVAMSRTVNMPPEYYIDQADLWFACNPEHHGTAKIAAEAYSAALKKEGEILCATLHRFFGYDCEELARMIMLWVHPDKRREYRFRDKPIIILHPYESSFVGNTLKFTVRYEAFNYMGERIRL